MKKTKIILTTIGAVLLLGFLIIIYGNFINPSIKRKMEISILPDYYKELAQKCGEGGCCLASVKRMSAGNFKLMPKDGCPDVFKPNMLKCVDTLKWCEPQK